MMDFEWRWLQLKPFFGNLQFHLLTPQHVEDYKIQRLQQGVCKRTILHELTYLASMWKWAAKNNYCSPPHFVVEKFDNQQNTLLDTLLKINIPTPDEIRGILSQMHPRTRVLAMLMYYGGLRRSEALQLKRSNINFNTGLMRVIGKGSKPRLVPIPDNAELLGEMRQALAIENKTDYLIINPCTKEPYNNILTGLKAAAKRAGYPDRVWHHLLRHTYVTHGAEAGVDPRTMQLNVGHADLKTTETYTHIASAHRIKETTKFSRYVELNTTVEVYQPRNYKKTNTLVMP